MKIVTLAVAIAVLGLSACTKKEEAPVAAPAETAAAPAEAAAPAAEATATPAEAQ